MLAPPGVTAPVPTRNPRSAPARDLRQFGAENRMSMWVGRSSGQIWTCILESGNPVKSADPVVLYINDKHLKIQRFQVKDHRHLLQS